MTLVVETGSGDNSAANTYATVAELRAHSLLRGDSLDSSSDSTLESLLIQAMDYLESLYNKFKGYPTAETQPLQWPRADVWDIFYPGASTASDEIPTELKRSQMSLALDAQNGGLMDTVRAGDRGAVLSESIDGISVSYADAKSGSSYMKANADLNKLCAPGLAAVRI